MSAAETPIAAEQVNLLLVDDREENLLALEAILEPLGHRQVRATSGDAALRRLLELDFAVILLDVQMPGMNGFETARMIKARERTRHIPIMFLTALSKDQSYVFEGYSVGAVDYVTKPFEPEILRSKVAAFVDLHLKQKQHAEEELATRNAERQELELRHLRELLQSEARYRDILRSALDAIVAFDEGGIVTLFNREAERMFRCRAVDAIGAPISKLFSKMGDDAHTAERLRAIADEARQGAEQREVLASPQPVALSARRVNGEEFPIEASVSVLEGYRGVSCTLILRDVSDRLRAEAALREQSRSLARTTAELKALNDELSERQAELERALTSRNRFYASMSHELRTPINAVLGYSQLLLEHVYGPLNPKQSESLERTQKSARHLLELVNDVLDLSKIEAGKIDLRLQPVSFPSVVTDLFATVSPLADEHGSTLETVAPDGDVTVTSDPVRVRQILLNLLSNAIKFGSGGPIRVECAKPAAGGVTVRVVDSGAGIPKQDQERIFEEFVQLGQNPQQKGTGLGLPISRKLAELLSGTLTVESSPGAGSTFTLCLPADPEAEFARKGGATLQGDREVPRPEIRAGDRTAPEQDVRLERPAAVEAGVQVAASQPSASTLK